MSATQTPADLLEGSQFVSGTICLSVFHLTFFVSHDGQDVVVHRIPVLAIGAVRVSDLLSVTAKGGRGRYRFALKSAGSTEALFEFLEKLWLGTLTAFRSLSLDGSTAVLFKGLVAPTGTADGMAGSILARDNGWRVYSAEEEYARLKMDVAQWRLSSANSDFALCSSYPPDLIVPVMVSDSMLVDVAAYRRKGRLPVIVWRHARTQATLARCGQPASGLLGHRSEHDELYMHMVRFSSAASEKAFRIYDARPQVNAKLNQVKGGGTENVANYRGAELSYFGIENIHVMRDSMEKLADACRSERGSTFTDWYSRLADSQWLAHVAQILSGARQIASAISIEALPVLVHCSDGWDRTPQLTSLAMILMDGYFRTIDGLAVIVESQWVAFGHRFGTRSGQSCDVAVRLSSSDTATGAMRRLAAAVADKREDSPVFLQFLDCLHQVMRQYPRSFEFNEALLLFLADATYSCLYGNFLFDCLRDKRAAGVASRTRSVWADVHAARSSFTNLHYRPNANMLSISTSPKHLVLWEAYFLQSEATRVPFESTDAHIAELFAGRASPTHAEVASAVVAMPTAAAIADGNTSAPSIMRFGGGSEDIESAGDEEVISAEDISQGPRALAPASVPPPASSSSHAPLFDSVRDRGERAAAASAAATASADCATGQSPKWVPDKYSPRCAKCAAAFSLALRRHHCRKCGRVFCSKCSKHSLELPELRLKGKQRVCDWCFNRATPSLQP